MEWILILVLRFLHCVRGKFSEDVSRPTAAPETSSGNLPCTQCKNPNTKNQYYRNHMLRFVSYCTVNTLRLHYRVLSMIQAVRHVPVTAEVRVQSQNSIGFVVNNVGQGLLRALGS